MASASSYPELRKFLQHADASYHLTDLPVEDIRSSLVEWYAQHRRHLPWRGDAPPYNGSTAGFAQRAAASSPAPSPTAAAPAAVSAYGVWVSEIMCQQTRVEAVIPYWLTWLEAFPTVEALAAASEDEVNAKWAGLGFYRRARMLHEGAKQVVESHGGELPRDVAGLLLIKGIGPYTAGAVASIVGGVAAPVVDGNVLRVVSRLCAVAATAKEPLLCDEKRGVAWTVARALVEAGGGAEPGALNQALMEVGATYCAPAGSGVDGADPLAPFYRSTKLGREAFAAHRAGDLEALLDGATGVRGAGCPSSKGADAFLDGLRAAGAAPTAEAAATIVHQLLPLPLEKKARREERHAVAALFCDDAADADAGVATQMARRWLLAKRPATGLLAGQWEFPHAVVASDAATLPDDPGAPERSLALNNMLLAAAESGSLATLVTRQALAEPLEHIFSHVRHTMHVEYAAVANPPRLAEEAAAIKSKGKGKGAASAAPREFRWMAEDQMKEVGVTAGVLKVIAAVRAAEDGGGKTTTKGKKRAQAAPPADGAPQKKISSFFAKPKGGGA